jgi:plastocyanin
MQDSSPPIPNLPNVPVVTPPEPRRHTPGKWLMVAVVLVMVGVASVLLIQNKPKQSVRAEPTATVQITSAGFVPETITIKESESITWVNTDNGLHQVAADPKLEGFATEKSLDQHQSITFTFDKKGTYTYHDPLHPNQVKATVIVE